MGKCSTLIYLDDSLDYPEGKIIEIDKLLEDIDLTLGSVFQGLELETGSQLVSKTMAGLVK